MYWGFVFQGSTLLILILIIYFSRVSWKRLGNLFLRKFVQENFEMYLMERNGGFQRYKGFRGKIYKYLLMLFGLYLDPKKEYFIEEEVPDVDMTQLRKIYKDRISDLLSACLGTTVLIASLIKNSLTLSDVNRDSAINAFLGLSFLAMVLSPILVGWLIPMIWTLQDSAIREITDRKTVKEISDNVRNGPASRLLGFAGFIGGLTLLMDVIPLIAGEEINVVGTFIVALLILLMSLPIILGPAYLVGLLYFVRNHQENVNNLRFSLFERGLPLGMTMVRNANEEEIMRFQEISKDILVSPSRAVEQLEPRGDDQTE